MRTATAEYQAMLREYQRVNIQDLVSYPGSFADQKIIVRAEAYEIEDGGRTLVLWLYSYAGSGFITAYPERMLTPESGVLEGYTYNVYGTVGECGSRVIYDLDGWCLYDVFVP